MATVVEILTEARGLVAKGWARGAWAKDKKKCRVHYSDRTATCFCASGAIYRATHDHITWRYRTENYVRSAARLRTTSLAEWNDAPSRTKAQVLAAFDRAIKLAKGAS